MSTFVDTSAFLAMLDVDDAGHADVVPAWTAGVDAGEGFVTTNYVAVETCSLIQHRLGTEAVASLLSDVLPLVHTEWVAEQDHAAGAAAMLAAGRRRLSLVDCVSFIVMRRLSIRLYLGRDKHFDEQGFGRYAPAD
jgi:uncharacterized protein